MNLCHVLEYVISAQCLAVKPTTLVWFSPALFPDAGTLLYVADSEDQEQPWQQAGGCNGAAEESGISLRSWGMVFGSKTNVKNAQKCAFCL